MIHRDIKPANIIVGKYGETLVVDWGLAKAIGRADPSAERADADAQLRQWQRRPAGHCLGTPAYMSPEQARRARPTRPAVGCLQPGRDALLPADRQAAVRRRRIGAILRACRRATSRRRATGPLDRQALEAICGKAMALSLTIAMPRPVLADDLERWMADEPVTAWREPLSRRGRRWARRNRTAVTAALVALVAGLVGLGAVATVQTRANGELRAANTEVKRVNSDLAAEKARVQERLRPGDGRNPNLSHRRQRGFSAQGREIQRPARPAAEVGQRLLWQAGGAPEGPVGHGIAASVGKANFELAELTTKVGRTEAALGGAPSRC